MSELGLYLAVSVTILFGMLFPRLGHCAAPLNFPPSDFQILSADTRAPIGHGHYSVDQVAGGLVLHGENRYLSGEYDIEEDHLTATDAVPTPVLSNFRHDFYSAEGKLVVSSFVDMETGLGVCRGFENGKMALASKRLSLPEDTYAGASVLLPIQDFVRRANRDGILKLHVFNCVPSPKVVAVDVKLEPRPQIWSQYPGQLEKIDVQPDFGFWTILILPFVPKIAAWFDPSQESLLVGAQLQRYYKGAKIVLVRAHSIGASISAAANKSPSVAAPPP